MAKKKLHILLEKDVPQLGQKGEIKQVALGYAHNFLLPKGLARLATPKITAQAQQAKIEQAKIQQEVLQIAKKVAEQLQSQRFEVQARASSGGKLFASLGQEQILEVLNKQGIDASNFKLISKPIKQTGEHKVKLDLGYGQKAEVKLIVKAAEA